MKKLTAIAAALLCLVLCAAAAFGETVRLGDVDGDGRITAKDARSALRASAKLEKFDERTLFISDMDSNGRLTASDARTILRISAKLASEPASAEYGSGETTQAPATTTAPATTAAPTTRAPIVFPPSATTTVPTTAEPTTAEPSTEETTAPAEESTEAEITTAVPTTVPVTTPEEPATSPEEPVSIPEEPSSEPAPEEPSSSDEVKIPAAIQAFLDGRYRFKGTVYADGESERIDFATNGTDIRAVMAIDSSLDVTVLVKTEKTLFGREKKVVYFLAEKDGKKYYAELNDAIKSMAGIDDDLISSLNVTDVDAKEFDKVEATGLGRDIWGFKGDDAYMDVVLEGDQIKRITTYNGDGAMISRMDIEEYFYGDALPDSDFTLDGYSKYPGLSIGFFSWLMGI